jgi:hypothetical protein
MREPEGQDCAFIGADGCRVSCVEPVARLLTHELRTPLNAIIGFAELLLAGGSGGLSSEARAAVIEIARAAQNLESTMTAAGFLIELGLLPPRTAAGPVLLNALLADAGFELAALDGETVAAPVVVEGTRDRWVAILGAVRSFLGRRASARAACLAAAERAAEGLCLRLWTEPGPVHMSDLARIELSLAARLTAVEGAALALGGDGVVRLTWSGQVTAVETVAAGMAPNGFSGVS